MQPTHALLGFAAWTLLLVLVIFGYRGMRLLQGTPINSWGRGKKTTTDPAFIERVEAAHANCLENLVLFAVIVLAADALSKSEFIAGVASWVLFARIGQSVVHLIGTSQPLVLVRASFWSVQVALFAWMLWRLVG